MKSPKITKQLRVARSFCGKIVDDFTFKPGSQDITIGEHQQTLLATSQELSEGFCLLQANPDGGYTLRLTEHLQGKVHLSGRNLSTADLIRTTQPTSKDITPNGTTSPVFEIPLRDNDWGVLRLGAHQEVIFQFVIPNRAILSATALSGGAGLSAGAVRALASIGGASLLAAAVLLCGFIFSTMYLHKDAVDLEVFSEDTSRVIAFHSEAVEEINDEELKLQPPEEDTEIVTAIPTEPASAAPEGPEGAFGDSKKTNETKLTKNNAPLTNNAPKSVGVAKVLGSNFASSIAVNFGAGPLGDVNEQFVSTNGTNGAFVMGMGVDGGMGLKGYSPGGGGGPGGGTIGGLNGQPGGDGPGGQPRPKTPEKGKPKIKEVTISGAPTAGKFCKAESVKAVVTKKSARIRNCYERRLLADPKLSGKIIAQWKIQLDGSVKDAKVASSTMSDDEVGRCLVRLLETSKFDAPDGGVCVIEFPFSFSAH